MLSALSVEWREGQADTNRKLQVEGRLFSGDEPVNILQLYYRPLIATFRPVEWGRMWQTSTSHGSSPPKSERRIIQLNMPPRQSPSLLYAKVSSIYNTDWYLGDLCLLCCGSHHPHQVTRALPCYACSHRNGSGVPSVIRRPRLSFLTREPVCGCCLCWIFRLR